MVNGGDDDACCVALLAFEMATPEVGHRRRSGCAAWRFWPIAGQAIRRFGT
jgi:hypothetical protein